MKSGKNPYVSKTDASAMRHDYEYMLSKNKDDVRKADWNMVKGVIKNTDISLPSIFNSFVQSGGILGKIALENLGIVNQDTFTNTSNKESN